VLRLHAGVRHAGRFDDDQAALAVNVAGIAQVWMTSPSLTKSRFASQTCCFNSSSMGSDEIISDLVADVNQFLHHAVKMPFPRLRAEGVVQFLVERVKFLVIACALGFGL